jgi:hypothetical protein
MIGTTPTPALKCFDDSTFGGLQILKGKSEVLGTFVLSVVWKEQKQCSP